MTLARRINPFQLLLISINGMVGSAWLFAPLYAAKIAGTGAIYAWLIGGGMTLLIALTFAELSARFPVPGGTTQIPEISHGKLTGFIIGWTAWLSALTMSPIEVQAVIQYSSTYFPNLVVPNTTGIVTLTSLGYVLALGLMLLLATINIASFKGLLGSNQFIFAYKILIIILMVALLPTQAFHASNFSMTMNADASTLTNIMTAVASGGIAFAFTGFKHGVELAGEASNQRVAIPVAVGGSVLCCLFLYLALQIVFIGGVDPSHLQQGWHQLQFSGDTGPFAGILLALGLFWLLKLLYIDAVVSPLGAGLIYMTSTARIIYAMGQRGQLPAILTKTNQQKLPIVAILVNTALGMFLFVPLKGWQAMTDFLVSLMVISYAMGPLALMCLVKSPIDSPKSFKLPLRHIVCPIAFYCCNLISYWTGWLTIQKLVIVLVVGLIFFLVKHRNHDNKYELGLRSLLWLVPYFSGLTLISYLGNFDGHHIIPFGWDFALLAVFSIVIMWLAHISRSPDNIQTETLTTMMHTKNPLPDETQTETLALTEPLTMMMPTKNSDMI